MWSCCDRFRAHTPARHFAVQPVASGFHIRTFPRLSSRYATYRQSPLRRRDESLRSIHLRSIAAKPVERRTCRFKSSIHQTHRILPAGAEQGHTERLSRKAPSRQLSDYGRAQIQIVAPRKNPCCGRAECTFQSATAKSATEIILSSGIAQNRTRSGIRPMVPSSSDRDVAMSTKRNKATELPSRDRF
jgi:hypothetical protein